VVPDTEVVLNSSCELTPAPKTVSVADGVKLVSVADSAGKREPQWLSNSLSIVSEEAGLKSLSQGSLLCCMSLCAPLFPLMYAVFCQN